MTVTKDIPQLAIIIPCYNEAACVKQTTERLLEVLDTFINKGIIKNSSYLFFIDDGSKDLTWPIIEEMHSKDTRVKGTKFIRNFGNQKALYNQK